MPFKDDAMNQLAALIKRHGLLQIEAAAQLAEVLAWIIEAAPDRSKEQEKLLTEQAKKRC
jgi:hypothetical protein